MTGLAMSQSKCKTIVRMQQNVFFFICLNDDYKHFRVWCSLSNNNDFFSVLSLTWTVNKNSVETYGCDKRYW